MGSLQKLSPKVVAAVALVVATSALAVEAPEPEATLKAISVQGILPPDENEAPGAAGTLDAADIERLRPYNLHDALDYIPGVRTIDDDSLGRRSGIGVRGAPSRRSRSVLMLEDGVPINASTYLDASTHYTPPTERLERIEVLKANGQVIHGPLNNHAIVNFRNKRATATPETTANLAFGNDGNSRQHVMHRRTDGDVGTVFSYTRLTADGVFDVEDTRFQDFFASADWAISERQTLGVSAVYFQERSHYDESNLTPAEYAVAPRTKLGRFGQEYNTIAVNYLRADLNHAFELSDRLSIASKLFVTDLDRPRFTVDPGEYVVGALPALDLDDGDGAFVAGPNGNGQMISRDRHYQGFGAESRMRFTGFSAGGFEHDVQWGVRAERQLFLDRRTEGAVGEVLNEGNRGEITRDEKYQSTAVSGFLQDSLTRGSWTLTPGVRVERYTQSRQRVFPTLDARAEEKRSVLLPGVTLLHRVDEDTEAFAGVQRGYTPATARGSDFPLRPETGINSQLGLRSRVAPGIRLDTAVFYNRLQNTLVQLPYIDPETFASVVINEADSRAMGLDLGLRVDSAEWTSSALNAFGILAYNWTDAQFRSGISDGNRVPEIPRHTGSLTVGLEHRTGWSVSATATHEGRFFTDPANTGAALLANEDGEPLGAGDVIDLREPITLGAVASRTLFSARAAYRLRGDTATIWLQARNLTDKTYIGDYQNGLRPGAARTFLVGVSLRFD